MIKALLLGFGFLVVAILIAIAMVRYANSLGDSKNRAPSDSDDTTERHGH